MNVNILFIRKWLLVFIIVLLISGLTAIIPKWFITWLLEFTSSNSFLGIWLSEVYTSISDIQVRYPYLLYGYDWLFFAHILLAILFYGVYKNPVKNKLVIEVAIYACLLLIPFALIMGSLRGIPLWWRLIDCSFGIIGIGPLLAIYRKIISIEKTEEQHREKEINEYFFT